MQASMEDWTRSREPDISLAGLSIWITGYRYPDEKDYWTANFLDGLIRVTAPGACVELHGSILGADDFARFLGGLEKIDHDLRGKAELSNYDPAFRLEIFPEHMIHWDMRIEILREDIHQKHEFGFDIDQTYFKPAIAQCRQLLARFPVRGLR